MTAKLNRDILICLLAFLGLGAIGGGGILIISPKGKLFGMPLTMLDHTPFKDFLVPGIMLFSVIGVAPLLIIRALIKKPTSKLAERLNFFKDMHWAWSFTIYQVFALIIWVQVEMMFFNSVHWLQSFYMFYALLILFVALLPQVRNLCKT